ncbi:hypothetical protein DRO03_09355 [Methanosarcinales archaeon]|nr:MAG: hypothetical protein DRO03_09355 [Methanosarcinales archaeon]
MMKRNIFFILLFIPILIFADFSSINYGAKSMAMGNASAAMANGCSAVFINPAGMGKSNKISITLSHQNVFGVSGLYNESAAFSMPLPLSRIGIGYNEVVLLKEYYEQTFNLSASSIVRIKNILLYFGISGKIYHSWVNYSDASSPTKFDMDFGLLSQIAKSFSVGFTAKNLIQPEVSFIEYYDKIKAEYTLGMLYNWSNILNLTADYQFDKNRFNIGTELWFFDVFAPRIGLDGEYFTAGFGIKTKKWEIDTAVLSHDELGSNYQISMTINFK